MENPTFHITLDRKDLDQKSSRHIDINSKDINRTINKILKINRDFPRVFTNTEYADLLSGLNRTIKVLMSEVYSQYMAALNNTRQLDSIVNTMYEVSKDEQDAHVLLNQISEEYREVLKKESILIAQSANLKEEQNILQEVKAGSAAKVKRVLEGGNAINETTMDLFGKPFGEIYSSLQPKKSTQQLLEEIQAVRQKREQELKTEEKGEKKPDVGQD